MHMEGILHLGGPMGSENEGVVPTTDFQAGGTHDENPFRWNTTRNES